MQGLRITQEAAFGVYDSTPGVQVYPRLSSAGAFGRMEKPEYWTIMDGSGLGVQAMSGTQTMTVAGNLVTEIGPTLAAFLMPWAFTRINAGQTIPWTTTEVKNDLASATFDYLVTDFARNDVRIRYLGGKASSVGLACSRDQPKLMGTFGVLAGTPQPNAFDSSTAPTAEDFPELDCADAPQDCYLFQNMAGQVTVLGAARTNFDSFSLQLTNNLKPYFDESHFANAIRLGGRTLVVNLRCRLKATPDDWAAYKAGTVGTSSFKFVNGAHSLQISMGAKCYINQIDQESPITEEPYYTITLVNQLDPATCTDFSVTIV
jgi:hypothetical protein